MNRDPLKLLKVNQWGDIEWLDMNNAFHSCENMRITATDAPNLTQVRNMWNVFTNCKSMNDNINHWDVSNINNFTYAFQGASSFNQPLDNWNVGKVTSLLGMFDGCTSFNQNLNTWNVSNVTDFSKMFSRCSSFNQPLNNWNTSKGENFSDMFNRASIFNQDISGWEVGNGTRFTSMFAYTNEFNQDVNAWSMYNAIYTNAMFLGNRAFNFSLISWDVSNVKNMAYMFSQSIFNSDISTWSTNNVTDMGNMFWNNRVFNQPIGNWDVSNVLDMQGMFRGASVFNQDISQWNVGSVTNMTSIFMDAPVFKQDLSQWNVGNVQTMDGMFYLASAFNSDIRNWNVSNVTSMKTMFFKAIAFDQDIGKWNIEKVVDFENMFLGAKLSVSNYDALLEGWQAQNVQPNISFHGGNSKYCFSYAERSQLISSDNWTIVDGGEDCATVAFITTWKTDNPGTSNSTSITIPTIGNGYNYDVDWNNDGVYDEFGLSDNITHDFGVPGTYTIQIRGDFPRIYFDNTGDKEKLLDVVQWGNVDWTSMHKAFTGCINLNVSAIDAPNLSKVTDLTAMFSGCESFNSDINHWDVSTITSMHYTFLNCKSFNQDLNNWNVGNVVNMRQLFTNCTAFNGDVTNWDVSSVRNFGYVFNNCKSFNRDIGNWNTSNGITMLLMFAGAEIFNQDISSWNVSNVWQFAGMFNKARTFNQNIGNWDTSNATTMASMFEGASHFKQDISNWDVSNVKNMNWMFANADSFNQDIGSWNTASVTDMNYMFFNNDVFNQDIGDWNTSNVEVMQNMFNGAKMFNQDLSRWDTGNVTTMSSMFQGTPIDQDFGSWNVSNVADMTRMFNGATLSTPNYDSLLIGWASRPVQQNVPFHAGYSVYCKGYLARISLINDNGWDIIDGGSEKNAPIAVCQDITVYVNADGTTDFDITSLDNGSYDGCTTVKFSSSRTTFNCSDIGTTFMEVLTVEDENGNASSCNSQITLMPSLDIECPDDIEITLASNECNAVATWTEPSKPCGSTLESNYISGDTFPIGDTEVIYTLKDNFGNSNSCSFYVRLRSVLILDCPSDIELTLIGSDCQLPVYWSEPSEPCGTTLSASHNSGNSFGIGETTVNYSLSDDFGNSKTCSFKVIITPKLEITNMPSDITLSVNNEGCAANYSWTHPTVPCGISLSPPSHATSEPFPVGTTEVLYTATNSSGMSISDSFKVTVTSDIAMIIENVKPTDCSDSSNGVINISGFGGSGNYKVAWYDGSNAYLGEGFEMQNLSFGEYKAVLSDAYGCSVSQIINVSGPIKLTAYSEINKTSDGQEIAMMVSGGTAPYTCEWYGDRLDENIVAEKITIKKFGEYFTLITDANGCQTTVATNIHPSQTDCVSLKYRMLPNPTKEIARLTFENCLPITNIRLYDLIGRLIFQTNTNDFEYNLDVSQFDAQTYLVVLSNGEQTVSEKLVVE